MIRAGSLNHSLPSSRSRTHRMSEYHSLRKSFRGIDPLVMRLNYTNTEVFVFAPTRDRRDSLNWSWSAYSPTHPKLFSQTKQMRHLISCEPSGNEELCDQANWFDFKKNGTVPLVACVFEWDPLTASCVPYPSFFTFVIRSQGWAPVWCIGAGKPPAPGVCYFTVGKQLAECGRMWHCVVKPRILFRDSLVSVSLSS